jgi:hypothetical protein
MIQTKKKKRRQALGWLRKPRLIGAFPHINKIKQSLGLSDRKFITAKFNIDIARLDRGSGPVQKGVVIGMMIKSMFSNNIIYSNPRFAYAMLWMPIKATRKDERFWSKLGGEERECSREENLGDMLFRAGVERIRTMRRSLKAIKTRPKTGCTISASTCGC